MLKKVFCIDDDLLTLKLIDYSIKNTFFAEKIIKFSKAIEAINYLGLCITENLSDATTPPQLIFLDINMPQMNGWAFLDEFDKVYVNRLPEIKIVLLSSTVNPEDSRLAGNYPFIIDFIFKPLKNQDLSRLKAHPALSTYFS